jgi:hypothetical protein
LDREGAKVDGVVAISPAKTMVCSSSSSNAITSICGLGDAYSNEVIHAAALLAWHRRNEENGVEGSGIESGVRDNGLLGMPWVEMEFQAQWKP